MIYRLSRTLVDVMGVYFANEIVQSCGKGYETEVTKTTLQCMDSCGTEYYDSQQIDIL